MKSFDSAAERKPVSVVIDREYGSGGREVARILSEKLNMEFYDGNLLVMAGMEYGLNIAVLQDYDDKGVGSLFKDMGILSRSIYADGGGATEDEPYQVYSAISRLVQQMVAVKPRIFLGRCTAHILATEAHVPFIHAFVYASDMADRIERAKTVDGVETDRIEAYIRKKDNQRKNFYRFFTDKAWDDPKNYDLMLNTSRLGYEGAANAIIGLMNLA